jgi:hypothetical protein
MGTISLIMLTVATGLAVFFWRSLNPAPQLQITDRGILDRRLSIGWLPWDSIEGAYRPRRPDGNRVLLRVRVDDRLGRAASAEKTPGLLELALDLSGTPYSEMDVLQEIMARSHASGLQAPLVPRPAQVPCGLR